MAYDFYETMFGWEKGISVDMGPMGNYQLFTIKGVDAGGMFNSPAATAHPFWLFYFVVDDIEAAAERITHNGGTIAMGPHEVPGGGWIIQGNDPQGAWFAVTGPKIKAGSKKVVRGGAPSSERLNKVLRVVRQAPLRCARRAKFISGCT